MGGKDTKILIEPEEKAALTKVHRVIDKIADIYDVILNCTAPGFTRYKQCTIYYCIYYRLLYLYARYKIAIPGANLSSRYISDFGFDLSIEF